MRAPNKNNKSNIVDQLKKSDKRDHFDEKSFKDWQFKSIKAIISSENAKSYAIQALTGGNILSEFHPILVEAIRPIGAKESALLLNKIKVSETLENELVNIILSSKSDIIALAAVKGNKISLESETKLIKSIKTSSSILKLLSECQINKSNQLIMIQKMNGEDQTILYRKNIFIRKSHFYRLQR